MQITVCLVQNIYFLGKVNVAVVVGGVLLFALLVAIIIVVLWCWIRIFKSKKDGLSGMSGKIFK